MADDSPLNRTQRKCKYNEDNYHFLVAKVPRKPASLKTKRKLGSVEQDAAE